MFSLCSFITTPGGDALIKEAYEGDIWESFGDYCIVFFLPNEVLDVERFFSYLFFFRDAKLLKIQNHLALIASLGKSHSHHEADRVDAYNPNVKSRQTYINR